MQKATDAFEARTELRMRVIMCKQVDSEPFADHRLVGAACTHNGASINSAATDQSDLQPPPDLIKQTHSMNSQLYKKGKNKQRNNSSDD